MTAYFIHVYNIYICMLYILYSIYIYIYINLLATYDTILERYMCILLFILMYEAS